MQTASPAPLQFNITPHRSNSGMHAAFQVITAIWGGVPNFIGRSCVEYMAGRAAIGGVKFSRQPGMVDVSSDSQ